MDEELDRYGQRRERISDDGSPRKRLAMPTLDEIRYAEQLRLQIRASYQRNAIPRLVYWSVGVE